MKKRPGRCRRCHKSDGEVGRISWAGLCVNCSTDAVVENATGISLKRGPAYERWRDGLDAARERERQRIIREATSSNG